MMEVSHSEARLLTLARYGLGFADDHEVLASLLTRHAMVGKLSPRGVEVLQDTLARGTVHALAHGGWRRDFGGRLWERAGVPPLSFTPAIFQVLNWLLFAPLAADQVLPLSKVALTPAEDFFCAHFLLRQRDPRVQRNLLRQPVFQNAPLTRLLHAGRMAWVSGEVLAPVEIDLAVHGVFLEALGGVLASTWAEHEDLKRACKLPRLLLAVGQTQSQTLSQYLALVNAADRRELATWVIEAARLWLDSGKTAADLVGTLDPSALLKDRVAARKAAGTLMEAAGTVHAWDEAHRTVHFVDDGYKKAQELLKLWQPHRECVFTPAAQIVEVLAQLPG